MPMPPGPAGPAIGKRNPLTGMVRKVTADPDSRTFRQTVPRKLSMAVRHTGTGWLLYRHAGLVSLSPRGRLRCPGVGCCWPRARWACRRCCSECGFGRCGAVRGQPGSSMTLVCWRLLCSRPDRRCGPHGVLTVGNAGAGWPWPSVPAAGRWARPSGATTSCCRVSRRPSLQPPTLGT